MRVTLARGLAFVAGGGVLLVACNQLLDNTKGRLAPQVEQSEADPTHPPPGPPPQASDPPLYDDDAGDAAPPTDAGKPDAEPPKDAGREAATEPPLDAGADADAAWGPVTCDEGTKLCAGLCVSITDPSWGCGAAACAPCALDNAAAACVEGACSIANCMPEYADCNGVPDDGCEANLANDPENCGTCQHVCFLGACARGACAPL